MLCHLACSPLSSAHIEGTLGVSRHPPAPPEDRSPCTGQKTRDYATRCGARTILTSSPTAATQVRNDRLSLINGLDGKRWNTAQKQTRSMNRRRNVQPVFPHPSRDARVVDGKHSFRTCANLVGSSRRIARSAREVKPRARCLGWPILGSSPRMTFGGKVFAFAGLILMLMGPDPGITEAA